MTRLMKANEKRPRVCIVLGPHLHFLFVCLRGVHVYTCCVFCVCMGIHVCLYVLICGNNGEAQS